jgi:hypothetical protein
VNPFLEITSGRQPSFHRHLWSREQVNSKQTLLSEPQL